MSFVCSRAQHTIFAGIELVQLNLFLCADSEWKSISTTSTNSCHKFTYVALQIQAERAGRQDRQAGQAGRQGMWQPQMRHTPVALTKGAWHTHTHTRMVLRAWRLLSKWAFCCLLLTFYGWRQCFWLHHAPLSLHTIASPTITPSSSSSSSMYSMHSRAVKVIRLKLQIMGSCSRL